jgi:AraC-like DNA-binding protein
MNGTSTVLASADVLPFIERVSEAVSQRHAAEAGWRNVLAWTLALSPGRFELPGFDDHHLIVHLSERSRMGLGFAGDRPQDHILMTGAMSFVPAGVPATFDIQSRNRSLQLLQRELVEPRIGSSALADGLLQVLAVHILRELAPADTTRRERVWLLSERQVRQAIGFMRANLQEDLNLKDIAEAVGLSVYHFARAFRASVGVPPHQYLIQLRISRARELLASGDLALARIAFETGFKSQSHFTYAFKRTLRVTPREYRRIART